MRQAHSTKWRSSVQPRKQRKYLHNAPLHLKGAMLGVHLSKELRQRHGVRAVRVRTGDKVRVLRGTHKGKESKVERIDLVRGRLILSKVETKKLQGGTAKYPIRPSNCMIIELAAEKRRFKRAAAPATLAKQETKPASPKPATMPKEASKAEPKQAAPAKTATAPKAVKPTEKAAPKKDAPAPKPAAKTEKD